MATILISTLPVLGHINPALAAARKLKVAGHKVIFALPERWRKLVEQSCHFIPTNEDELLYEPVTFRFALRYFAEDIGKIERSMWSVLAVWTCSQIDRLRQIADKHHPSLIISDCLHIAPLLVARERGIPSAVLGVTPYRNLLRGSAPLGSGLAPTSNWALAIAYDIINRTINWLFRKLRGRLTKCLSTVSPRPFDVPTLRTVSVFGICQELSDAYLQCSSPCLEDNGRWLQENGVEFIGPMNEEQLSPDLHEDPPAFQTKLPSQEKKPTVVITWGTMQPLPSQEFLSVAREFVWSSGFNVVVVPPDKQRDHVKFELQPEVTSGLLLITKDFKDFIPKLKGADVFVSNGGFGAVKAALTLGVPVVCAGTQDDKPDVCGRVKRSGAGIGLPWRTGYRTIIKAVHQVLRDKSFAARARSVGLKLSECDESTKLEQIVAQFVVNRKGP